MAIQIADRIISWSPNSPSWSDTHDKAGMTSYNTIASVPLWYGYGPIWGGYVLRLNLVFTQYLSNIYLTLASLHIDPSLTCYDCLKDSLCFVACLVILLTYFTVVVPIMTPFYYLSIAFPKVWSDILFLLFLVISHHSLSSIIFYCLFLFS